MSAGYPAKMTSDNQQPPDHSAFPEGEDNVTELESAEHYVRAHELIEDLRAERRPAHEPGGEDDARLLATAALLHAAASEGAAVDPVFAARLFERLEAERQRQTAEPVAAAADTPAQEAPHATPAAPAASAASAGAAATEGNPPGERPQRAGVSRRGLLWGGLGAAAAALTGAAVTAALEQSGHVAQMPPAPPASALVPAGAGTWVAVAKLASVPLGSVTRFEAGAVIGYLQHRAEGFVALSGVCTHMACLLQWNSGQRTFDCPCHGGRFLTNGQPAPGAPYVYPPLPAIQTKEEDGQVWVYVVAAASQQDPQSGSSTPSAPSSSTPSHGYGPSAS